MNAILSHPSTQTHYETVADLVTALGHIPLSRIRMKPAPGTATEADAIALSGDVNKRLCELIDGTLVEKAMGFPESLLAGWLITYLNIWVMSGGEGVVLVPDGMIRLSPNQIRIPDISYFCESQFINGHRPNDAICSLIPDLAVEILSPSNRAGEMRRKREEYFNAGVKLVWEIDPPSRTIMVYTSLTDVITLTESDTLTGGEVLPGFSLSITTLFSRTAR